jgi:tetratricopeptide (TPR) repeat protein
MVSLPLVIVGVIWFSSIYADRKRLGEQRAAEDHKCVDLAYDLWSSGNLEGAEKQFRKAFAFYEEAGEKKVASLIASSLGSVCKDRGDLDSAEEFCRKAIAIAEELGDETCLTTAYTGLAEVLDKSRDFSEAKDLYWKALAILDRHDDKKEMAYLNARLGYTCWELNDHDEALEHWGKARDIYVDIGSPSDAEAMQDLIERIE